MDTAHSVRHAASRIEVLNLNRAYRIYEKSLKKIAAEILAFIKKPEDAELEIVFLDDEGIRVFNKRYKGEDAPTDVLSFKIDRREFGESRILGEILISSERALANSKVFGTKLDKELVLYIIHGILHLFGYDDADARGRTRMHEREEEILGYLCKRQILSKVLMRH